MNCPIHKNIEMNWVYERFYCKECNSSYTKKDLYELGLFLSMEEDILELLDTLQDTLNVTQKINSTLRFILYTSIGNVVATSILIILLFLKI